MERQTSLSPKAHLEADAKPYVPHDVIGEATKAGVTGLLAGAFAGGVRNALAKESLGITGFVVRQSPLIGLIGTFCPTSRSTQSRLPASRHAHCLAEALG